MDLLLFGRLEVVQENNLIIYFFIKTNTFLLLKCVKLWCKAEPPLYSYGFHNIHCTDTAPCSTQCYGMKRLGHIWAHFSFGLLIWPPLVCALTHSLLLRNHTIPCYCGMKSLVIMWLQFTLI